MAANSIAGFPLTHSGTETSLSPVEEVTRLYDELRAPVLRYLFSLRVAPQDAEELVQETFLALFHHLRSGRSRANLRGWIFRVAHNTALKQNQRLRRADQVNPLCDLADSQPGPEETVAAAQLRQRLMAVVNALPQLDRSCLSLRAEGMRYREIAEVLGISLGSVAASLEKSLSRLTRASKTGGS